MKIEQEGLGVSYELPDFRQRDVEEFWNIRRELDGGDRLSGTERNGNIVRAAARLGWLEGLKEKDVDDMRPNAVSWLANAIADAIAKAFEVPGE